jgi:FkbM family methyltransferase
MHPSLRFASMNSHIMHPQRSQDGPSTATSAQLESVSADTSVLLSDARYGLTINPGRHSTVLITSAGAIESCCFMQESIRRVGFRVRNRLIELQVCYRPGTSDEYVLMDSFRYDRYLPRVPEYEPKQDDLVIDVGAYIGTFAMMMATIANKGHIYAIEPSAESYGFLEKNVALNGLTNVSAFHLALGSHGGTTRLHHSEEGNWGHSTAKSFLGVSELAPVETFTHFIEKNHISRCDFMKLNCEGAEFDILLNSARETLAKTRLMLVLYHCDLVENSSEIQLVNHLRDCGFLVKIRNRSDQNRRGWIVAKNRNSFPAENNIYKITIKLKLARNLIKWL